MIITFHRCSQVRLIIRRRVSRFIIIYGPDGASAMTNSSAHATIRHCLNVSYCTLHCIFHIHILRDCRHVLHCCCNQVSGVSSVVAATGLYILNLLCRMRPADTRIARASPASRPERLPPVIFSRR